MHAIYSTQDHSNFVRSYYVINEFEDDDHYQHSRNHEDYSKDMYDEDDGYQDMNDQDDDHEDNDYV